MVGLDSVGLCGCWKLGKCCRTFLVEATRLQVPSLSFPFPFPAILYLDFHSKAKLVALSESIWMSPSIGVFKVHQFHLSKQLKLYFAIPLQWSRDLCFFAEHQLLLSKGCFPQVAASGFLHKHLQNIPGILQSQVCVSSGTLHEEVDIRQLFPWSLGWFGNLLHQNSYRSPYTSKV